MTNSSGGTPKNRWRLAIVVLSFGSLLMIAAATWFGWEPWNSFRMLYQEQPSGSRFGQHPWMIQPPTLLSSLSALFTLYIGGVLVLFVSPNRIRFMADRLSNGVREVIRLAFLGLVVAVLTAAISISSALTAGTLPLAFILAGVLFLSGFAGYIALAYALGNQLMLLAQWEHLSPLYALLLGTLIVYGLIQVPFLGLGLKVAFAAVSIGVVIDSRFGTGRSWSLSALRRD